MHNIGAGGCRSNCTATVDELLCVFFTFGKCIKM